MPRAFLIKKHSPEKENVGKSKDDEEPTISKHCETESEKDVTTTEITENKGPYDLTIKPAKLDEEPDPTHVCTQGVAEFCPKIVAPAYHMLQPCHRMLYKPQVLVPSVTRPTPSLIQRPVRTIEPSNLYSDGRAWMYPRHLSPYTYPYFSPRPPYGYPFMTPPPRMEMPLYSAPGSPWGPREGSPSPDTIDTCIESAGGSKASEASPPPTSHPPRYECEECSKSYATYSGLARHKQFHCMTESKKAFTCKYCDKVYVSLGALKMHIRTHTLPCKCSLCGKAFSRPWLLQGHIRTHTGEKPFSCPNCSRAFADRSNLRAHLMTHSDVKKYHCRSCTKTFSRMSLLSKHTEGGCSTIRYGAIPHC